MHVEELVWVAFLEIVLFWNRAVGQFFVHGNADAIVGRAELVGVTHVHEFF